MLWRYVATGCSLLFLSVGMFMLDCSYRFLGPLPDDPLQLCLRAEVAQSGSSFTIAIGLVLVSLNLLAITWLPWWMDGKYEARSLFRLKQALETNAYRLPDHAVGPIELEPPSNDMSPTQPSTSSSAENAVFDVIPDERSTVAAEETKGSSLVAMGLSRRVDLMEQMLSSEAITPAQIFKRWIGLLHEANDLHNRGILVTSDFVEINTRLVDFFYEPDSEEEGDPNEGVLVGE